MVAVQDLHIVVDLDVGSGDNARALLGQGQGGAVAGVHTDGHVLEVQQDFEHVLLQTFDRGVLMQHAVDSTSVMAKPGMDDSSTRRRALPSVCP